MASLAVARAALRHCRRHPTARLFPTVRVASYHSYPLPSNAAPNADVTETPIAQPEPLPSSPSRRDDSHGSGEQVATPTSATGGAVKPKQKAVRPRTKFRPRKAAMRLTPAAVERLRLLLDQPEPKLIKVGVRNRGCSGLSYHLEYVDKPGAFDETVEQDGVTVLIDSKALFSIIGSEMDWAEDRLNQRFVFKNPNIKEQCGCGESFMV
ncbi:iron sulfur assembly protein 1 [Ophiocordyceps camponoti-floridani]|uniref:Iron-sulfur assembly protein 1 n=1 Tax=Ophiocordyceps camponoti-floridani TaxID=2030778 RepID=A0A8H4VB21_9HYPO|nr:iron sulfur assembly protein 1 [Ophiocordyceps camponoti-floridani]